MEDILSMLQWPAMAISLAAAWWMGSRKAGKRIVAFVLLSVGNLLWIAWGWGEGGYALIALNVGLLALNVRGIMKNESEKTEASNVEAGAGAGAGAVKS